MASAGNEKKNAATCLNFLALLLPVADRIDFLLSLVVNWGRSSWFLQADSNIQKSKVEQFNSGLFVSKLTKHSHCACWSSSDAKSAKHRFLKRANSILRRKNISQCYWRGFRRFHVRNVSKGKLKINNCICFLDLLLSSYANRLPTRGRKCEVCQSLKAAERNLHIWWSRTFNTKELTGVCHSQSHLTVNLNRHIFDDATDMK
jgi:hypothetical protein